MTPRCIATLDDGARRCVCTTTDTDGYMCHTHRIPSAFLNLWNTAETRRMLAFTWWETIGEGQALIDRVFNRRTA